MSKELEKKRQIKFLINAFEVHNAGKEITWNQLYKAGLRKDEISSISKELRKRGFINQDSYGINQNKIKEIRAFIEEGLVGNRNIIDRWDNILEFLEQKGLLIFLMVIVLGAMTFFYVGNVNYLKETEKIEVVYTILPNGNCIPINLTEVGNETVYWNENCINPLPRKRTQYEFNLNLTKHNNMT